jgi:hypothetical protein
MTQSGHWPLLPRKRIIYAGYSTVRSNLSIAVCAPMAVESVTITVKVTVPLWVGVPDNVPALDNAIPFGGAPLTIDHT